MRDDEQTEIEPAELEATPLERALWNEATKPVLDGETKEDWEFLHAGGPEGQERTGETKGEVEDRLEQLEETRAREGWSRWQWGFLSNLRLMGGVLHLACRASAVSKPIVDKARARCKYFDRAVKEGMEASIDRIEAAVKVSATVGDPEPVFQGGVCVGYKRRKSEKAAEMLLKAKRPGEYRPDGQNQLAVTVQLPPRERVNGVLGRLTKVISGEPVEQGENEGANEAQSIEG